MITEDYVSFETAKLLKEKGFDEPCYAYWHEDENRLIISQSMHAIRNITNPCFFGPATPTLQMAMKWLRKIHGLHIMVDCIGSENYIPTIQFTHNSKDIKLEGEKSKIGGNGFDSYEEATESAIKYCLENLI